MAISLQSCRNDYVGDGATVSFPYVFKILIASDLSVITTNTLGVETVLSYPGDYTVSGIGNTNGGNVVMASAPTNLYQVTVRRIRELKQKTSIRNETEFYQASIEDGLDKLLMIDQQQQEQINRSIKLLVSEGLDFNPALPVLLGQIERVIGTNATGDGLELGPTFTEIETAEASAVAAAASAAAAAVSASGSTSAATTAALAAAAAAVSQAAAALSAAAAVSAGFDSTNSPHSVTDGQAATNLTGETFDGTVYSSVLIFFEVLRGTTVMAVGWLSLNYLNGTWRFVEGPYGGEVHGITWSVTQATTIGQLQAALDSGAGNGKIKFKKTYFPV